MIRIAIADDHPIVREGLRRIVADDSGIVVVGEASSMGRAGTPVRGLRLPHQRSLTRSAARGDSPHLPRGKYVSDSLAERLATEAGLGLTQAPHERLSDREFEVLCALGSGIAVQDAAAKLGLSPKTVSTYRARIFEKMHFSTGADLVRYAAQQGLIQ